MGPRASSGLRCGAGPTRTSSERRLILVRARSERAGTVKYAIRVHRPRPLREPGSAAAWGERARAGGVGRGAVSQGFRGLAGAGSLQTLADRPSCVEETLKGRCSVSCPPLPTRRGPRPVSHAHAAAGDTRAAARPRSPLRGSQRGSTWRRLLCWAAEASAGVRNRSRDRRVGPGPEARGPQLRWRGATLGCPWTPGVLEIPANSWLNKFLVEWSPSCGALRSPTRRGDEWEITSHQAAVTRSRSCRPLEGSLWLRPDLCPGVVDALR